MPRHLKVLSLTSIISFVSAISFLYLNSLSTPPFLTPLGTATSILGSSNTNPTKSDKIILGFLPYWNFKHRSQIRYDLLTHLALFGVSFDSQGNIIKYQDGYTEPGWTALNSTAFTHVRREARAAGTKPILVITAFDADTIDSIISNNTATQNLITQTSTLLTQKSFDGVNIDFEYAPAASLQSQQNFTRFVHQLSQSLRQQNPNYHISIDVFGDTNEGHRIWQIKELTPLVDHIIIMAYDYHRPSSTTAGPVAPLYGAGTLWKKDITASLADFTQKASSQQLILGVPYYGYEWSTSSNQHLALTLKDSGSTATYRRVQQVIRDKSPQINWDSTALSPWLTYQDGTHIQQIYYEDSHSLGFKYDLVRQSNLAGTAIWALGYDAGYSHLWELIETKFY